MAVYCFLRKQCFMILEPGREMRCYDPSFLGHVAEVESGEDFNVTGKRK
jgi:hypothetical protein